jgi:hypothetical protein
MKKLFYIGILTLACFEIANVYFIMPMPFSQRMRSIDIAYALHSWRWAFRIACGAVIVAGLPAVWRAGRWQRWSAPALLLLTGGVAYATNFMMSADRIFLNDELGGTPVVLVLAADEASFFAYQRPDAATRFALRGDSLIAPGSAYALSGRSARGALVPLLASQEFWHSWRTFQPQTKTY